MKYYYNSKDVPSTIHQLNLTSELAIHSHPLVMWFGSTHMINLSCLLPSPVNITHLSKTEKVSGKFALHFKEKLKQKSGQIWGYLAEKVFLCDVCIKSEEKGSATLPLSASEGMERYADLAPRVCEKSNTFAFYLGFI